MTPIFCTASKELALARLGDLLLVCSPKKEWSDKSWTEHLEQTILASASYGHPRVVLTFSPRGAPSARQRREVLRFVDRLGFDQICRQAIVVESAFMRGAVTAMSWLLKQPFAIKSYAMRDFHEACRWLGEAAPVDSLLTGQTLCEMLVAIDEGDLAEAIRALLPPR